VRLQRLPGPGELTFWLSQYNPWLDVKFLPEFVLSGTTTLKVDLEIPKIDSGIIRAYVGSVTNPAGERFRSSVPLCLLPSSAAQLLQNEELSSMRRLLSSGLVVFAGMVAIPPAVAPPTDTPINYKNDPRFAILRSFFSKTNCPATYYVEVFLEAADRYALDWRLLPSLCFIESTGGKSARHNNLFGWGDAQFATPTAGIHAVGYRLANSALYKDKDLDGILRTYNTSEDYPRRVKSVMREIAPSE